MSFLASDAAIAGTSAVQNAAFIAKGKRIIVSIFDTIPDNCIAFASNATLPLSIPWKAFCIQLLTVNVSIVPFNSATNEPIVIGIDTANIIFRICFVVFVSICTV